MKHLYNYGATSIRTEYSKHVLRAHLQGFKPMSMPEFVSIAAQQEIARLMGR